MPFLSENPKKRPTSGWQLVTTNFRRLNHFGRHTTQQLFCNSFRYLFNAKVLKAHRTNRMGMSKPNLPFGIGGATHAGSLYSHIGAISLPRHGCPARQNGDLGEISPIFRLFSAYGTPSAVFPHTCLRNSPISAYFLPIFSLKWYPILVINSSMEPICCFSTYMFTVSAYFPPIFRSFSAYFPPNLQPIFRRSSLAGCLAKHSLRV